MISIEWDPKALDFLRKIEKHIAKRIFDKIDNEVRFNPERYLETLESYNCYKVRIGDYRLFVDYSKEKEFFVIRAIRHRREAYKR
ncbi:type II toxin-antitoxin system RelE/ParE family toxin [Candidatus Woesearchaeota archaeon]|nr:type II toxin-antitoxin system RelE/ParE family toxin [Candidatus Woesearchaeota archaeon]